MKTLRRFWEWHDAEKPDKAKRLDAEWRNVSALGRDSLRMAETHILERMDAFPLAPSSNEPWDSHPEALRDLSLALCEALARMHEQVPEGPTMEIDYSLGPVVPPGPPPDPIVPSVPSPPVPSSLNELRLKREKLMHEILAEQMMCPRGVIIAGTPGHAAECLWSRADETLDAAAYARITDSFDVDAVERDRDRRFCDDSIAESVRETSPPAFSDEGRRIFCLAGHRLSVSEFHPRVDCIRCRSAIAIVKD